MSEKSKETQFKEGNQLWRQRTKHGRDTIFSSPQNLWESACEYFTWVENNPLISVEAKTVSAGNGMGSDVEMVEVPKMRAFSLKGLCIFLGVSSGYFRTFKVTHSESKSDFLAIIELIEDVIYTQKFEGAAAGLLKENLIARELGLKDGSDITTKGKEISIPIVDLSKYTSDELLKLANDTGTTETDSSGDKG